jgi:hypothetical protein
MESRQQVEVVQVSLVFSLLSITENYTMSALLLIKIYRGVQQLLIMIEMVNGEIALASNASKWLMNKKLSMKQEIFVLMMEQN